MCGIIGFTGSDEALAKRMADTIEHRGPDDWGIYADTRFTFFNRRLAVIDLSAKGHQPMWTPDNTLGIAYNGEIYNFRALRKDLEEQGEVFESESDTEVILRGFQREGESFFSKLRGMWVLAIYNPSEKTLTLSRDPFGIKPLYYVEHEGSFAFASEMKALNVYCREKKIKLHLSEMGCASYFSLGYAMHPYTVFEEIKKVAPGEVISISLEGTWKRSKKITFAPVSTHRTLDETLLDSVRHHLIADVPVGVFLSGGVDSTLIALMLKELGTPLHAFTVEMEGRPDSEYAKKVAEFSGLTHHIVTMTPDVLKESYDEFFMSVDEPVADTAIIPTLAVSKEARKFVTCVLSGEGGDELFFGYDRYATLRYLSRIRSYRGFFEESLPRRPFGLYRALARRVRLLEAFIRNDIVEAYLDFAGIGAGYRTFGLVADEMRRRLAGEATMSTLDTAFYLPDALLYKNDIGTMAHSVEGRTPFLDSHVAAFARSIPIRGAHRGSVGKQPLRRLLEERLPKGLIMPGKSGFSVPRELMAPLVEKDLPDALEVIHRFSGSGFLPRFFSLLNDDAYRARAFQELPLLAFSIVVFARVVSQYDVHHG